jgi:hypothetical protein
MLTEKCKHCNCENCNCEDCENCDMCGFCEVCESEVCCCTEHESCWELGTD